MHGHPVVVATLVNTAGMRRGGSEKCTCPNFVEFAEKYRRNMLDLGNVHVKMTDGDCTDWIGMYPGITKLVLHFECTRVPEKNTKSFAAQFIVACTDLEELELKGSGDGSIITVIAAYSRDRPRNLNRVCFWMPLMLGEPDMENHNYRDGLGFNAFYYDSTMAGGTEGGMAKWKRRHVGNATWTLRFDAAPPSPPSGM